MPGVAELLDAICLNIFRGAGRGRDQSSSSDKVGRRVRAETDSSGGIGNPQPLGGGGGEAGGVILSSE